MSVNIASIINNLNKSHSGNNVAQKKEKLNDSPASPVCSPKSNRRLSKGSPLRRGKLFPSPKLKRNKSSKFKSSTLRIRTSNKLNNNNKVVARQPSANNCTSTLKHKPVYPVKPNPRHSIAISTNEIKKALSSQNKTHATSSGACHEDKENGSERLSTVHIRTPMPNHKRTKSHFQHRTLPKRTSTLPKPLPKPITSSSKPALAPLPPPLTSTSTSRVFLSPSGSDLKMKVDSIPDLSIGMSRTKTVEVEHELNTLPSPPKCANVANSEKPKLSSSKASYLNLKAASNSVDKQTIDNLTPSSFLQLLQQLPKSLHKANKEEARNTFLNTLAMLAYGVDIASYTKKSKPATSNCSPLLNACTKEQRQIIIELLHDLSASQYYRHPVIVDFLLQMNPNEVVLKLVQKLTDLSPSNISSTNVATGRSNSITYTNSYSIGDLQISSENVSNPKELFATIQKKRDTMDLIGMLVNRSTTVAREDVGIVAPLPRKELLGKCSTNASAASATSNLSRNGTGASSRSSVVGSLAPTTTGTNSAFRKTSKMLLPPSIVTSNSSPSSNNLFASVFRNMCLPPFIQLMELECDLIIRTHIISIFSALGITLPQILAEMCAKHASLVQLMQEHTSGSSFTTSEALNFVQRLLQEKSNEAKEVALVSVMCIGPAAYETVDDIGALFVKEKAVAIKKLAIRALYDIGYPTILSVVPIIQEAAKKEKDENIKRMCAELLSKLPMDLEDSFKAKDGESAEQSQGKAHQAHYKTYRTRKNVDEPLVQKAIKTLGGRNDITIKRIEKYLKSAHPTLVQSNPKWRMQLKLTMRRMIDKGLIKKQPATYSL